MAHHLHADDLAALVESESDGGARERDVPHLVDCPGCRDRFRQLQRVRTRLVASAASAPAPRGFEERVMERVFASPKPAAQPTERGILVPRFSWPAPVGGGRRALMGVAAAAAVVLIAVFVAGLGQIAAQAWTLEQSIEAAKPMKGVHLSGTVQGRVGVEMWVRGPLDRMVAVDAMLLRTDDGLTVRVRGNSTLYHTAGQPVAYTDDAQTAGMTPVPGAAFLELVRKVSTAAEIDSRVDVLRLRKVGILRGQLTDAEGPKSFELEFDARTKLLTHLSFWHNLQRAGAPAFAADVRYYTELPDGVFEAHLPASLVYKERPLSVASEMVGLVATVAGERFTPGSAETAGSKVVEEVYRALIAGDRARVRQLAPVATLFTDAQMDVVFGGLDGQDRVTELVSLGEARTRGASPLGPLVVVPLVARHADGRLYDEKMIVQVRPDAEGGSCVVFGPHGRPYPHDRDDRP